MTTHTYSSWYSNMFDRLDALFGGLELNDIARTFNAKRMFNISLRNSQAIFSYAKTRFAGYFSTEIDCTGREFFNTVIKVDDSFDIRGSVIHEFIELANYSGKVYIIDRGENILAEGPFKLGPRDDEKKFLGNFVPLKMKLQLMGTI